MEDLSGIVQVPGFMRMSTSIVRIPTLFAEETGRVR